MTDVTVTPEVRTSAGAVRGRWEHDLAVFRGIPFAAPPVGDLRWKPPQPVKDWDDVRRAERFGPRASEVAVALPQPPPSEGSSSSTTPGPSGAARKSRSSSSVASGGERAGPGAVTRNRRGSRGKTAVPAPSSAPSAPPGSK